MIQNKSIAATTIETNLLLHKTNPFLSTKKYSYIVSL